MWKNNLPVVKKNLPMVAKNLPVVKKKRGIRNKKIFEGLFRRQISRFLGLESSITDWEMPYHCQSQITGATNHVSI